MHGRSDKERRVDENGAGVSRDDISGAEFDAADDDVRDGTNGAVYAGILDKRDGAGAIVDDDDAGERHGAAS